MNVKLLSLDQPEKCSFFPYNLKPASEMGDEVDRECEYYRFHFYLYLYIFFINSVSVFTYFSR